ncbi:Aldo/keto reductase [Atractiella rhizophila]|nr:Aldo/keto reductase [Atractiella rhizophila]
MSPAYDPKNMIFRNLGYSGLRVSVFSYGGWLTVGGTVNGDPVKELMQTAFEAGINFFDNAETYASGQSEREMGRVIKELGWKRSDIVLTTKIFFGTGGKEPNARGLSRKHIVEGLQASLERLQTPYVDVVFAHRPDATTPMEEVVRAFNHVIDRGMAFYWGTSEFTAAQIAEACEIAKTLGLIAPICEQPQYSMLKRDRKYKYGSTIWSPLASGVFDGKDGIPPGSRFDTNKDFFKDTISEFDLPEGKLKFEKIKQLGEIAKRLGTNQSALALAWTVKNPNVSTCILGATKPEQLKENLEALNVIPKLTDQVMQEIEEILQNRPRPAPTYGRVRI